MIVIIAGFGCGCTRALNPKPKVIKAIFAFDGLLSLGSRSNQAPAAVLTNLRELTPSV